MVHICTLNPAEKIQAIPDTWNQKSEIAKGVVGDGGFLRRDAVRLGEVVVQLEHKDARERAFQVRDSGPPTSSPLWYKQSAVQRFNIRNL